MSNDDGDDAIDKSKLESGMRTNFRKGDLVRLARRRKAQQGGPFRRQCAGEGTVVGFVPGGRDRKEHVVVRFPKGEFGFPPQELEIVAGRPRLA